MLNKGGPKKQIISVNDFRVLPESSCNTALYLPSGKCSKKRITVKILKIWMPEKFSEITLKFEQGGFIVE